jgi:hypothetical protein
VTRAPLRRFVPCSCKEGVGVRLEVLVRSGLALVVRDGEVKAECGVDPVTAAKAACLPACLIFLILAFVGRTICPFLVLGRAGQLSWFALWGPQQLAHFALCWQFSPVGPSCPSILEPQCPHRGARVHLTGLHQPWHPLIAWRVIRGFLLIILA